MQTNPKRTASLALAFLLGLAMLTASPLTVFADTPPGAGDTCAIYVDGVSDVGYATLTDALNDAAVGDVIYLLADIDTGGLSFSKIDLTIDLNGHTLNATESSGDALAVSGVTLTVMDSAGSGKLNATSTDRAGVFVEDGGQLILKSGEINATGDRYGVFALTSGKATVTMARGAGTASINSILVYGVRADGADSVVKVTGDVFGFHHGIAAYQSAEIDVYGNVTKVAGADGRGASASGENSKVNVTGNITAYGNGVIGASVNSPSSENQAKVWVGGNIYIGDGTDPIGAGVWNSGQIIVEGTINARIYIDINMVYYTIDDDVTNDPAYAAYTDTMPGYRLYCDLDAGAFVWVRDILTLNGPASMSLTEGYQATSSAAFTLTGSPAPTVTLSDTLGGKVSWNSSTKQLSVASGLLPGTYKVTLTATIGQETVSHDFTITVAALPILIPPTSDSTPALLAVLALALTSGAVLTAASRRRKASQSA
jgi:hypothetical protein